MTTEHPITPPPKLVEQWCHKWTAANGDFDLYLAGQAACWGADQELEACVEWCADESIVLAQELQEARRPKPPSLAEGALEALEQIDEWAVSNMNHLPIHDDLVTGIDAIRRALKRLQELEQQENNDN